MPDYRLGRAAHLLPYTSVLLPPPTLLPAKNEPGGSVDAEPPPNPYRVALFVLLLLLLPRAIDVLARPGIVDFPLALRELED